MPIIRKKKKQEIEQIKKEQGLAAASQAALERPDIKVTGRRDLTPQEKIDLAKKAVQQGAPPSIRPALAGTIQAAELEKKQQEEIPKLGAELEQVGVFEEPEKPEFEVEKRPGEFIPVAGELATSGTNVLFNALKFAGNKIGLSERGERIISPELIRTEGLNEVERQVFRQGITATESLGEIIEALPFVGRLARQAKIQLPAGKADTIISNIKLEVDNINELIDDPINPNKKLDRIRIVENEINRLEARLQLMIIHSPEIRSNPDEIDKINNEIYGYRTAVRDAKINIAGQALSRIIPEATDEEISLRLEKMIEARQ